MFDPPPGFVDLLFDAAGWPITGELHPLDVRGVGRIQARRPAPRAAAALAMTANKKLLTIHTPKHNPALSSKQREQFHARTLQTVQLDYFTLFVLDHIGEEEYDRMCRDMLNEDVPHDAIQRIARAVATWGTARPYTAVITLALFTGHNWRTVRQKLAMAGIANPLTMPSLHSVLDITEDIVLDSLFRSAEKKDGPPSEGENKVRKFLDTIYAPDKPEIEEVNGDDYHPVPTGFDDASEVEADFDAFMRSAR